MPALVPVTMAAVGVMVALFHSMHRGRTFHRDACNNLYDTIRRDIVGQDWSIAFVTAQICDHLDADAPSKPLVVSIHGTPGVGKTMFHRQLARALYNVSESRWSECPGEDCPGYKVLFSMSYVPEDRARQAALLQQAVLAHVERYPESILVIEEYDKADPDTRGVLRQLIDGGRAHNISLARSIFILESNAGFLDIASSADDIEASLRLGGSGPSAVRPRRSVWGSKPPPPPPNPNRISPEDLMRRLKDIVYQRWREEECAGRPDQCDALLKTVNLIDAYVPFLPLKRATVRRLVVMNLERRRERLLRAQRELSWEEAVVDFLVDRVEFDSTGYAVEGAKEVDPSCARYVTRILRTFWPEDQRSQAAAAAAAFKQSYSRVPDLVVNALFKAGGDGGRRERRKLVVTEDGYDLELLPV